MMSVKRPSVMQLRGSVISLRIGPKTAETKASNPAPKKS